MASFDVIVIGGGPAGSAAAIACRQNGLKTLVLEADAEPRERPGETLHPGVESLFRQLGVLAQVEQAGFPRHRGHFVKRDGRVFFQPYGQDERGAWRGFQAARSQLDCILLTQAQAAGAEVLRPMRALEVLMEDARPVGVRTLCGDFGAPWIVDAAGPAHWAQKQLGLALLQVSDPLVARFGWKPVKGAGEPEFEVVGCAWRWEATVAKERSAWVELNLNQRTAIREGRGRDVTWRMVRPCAGRGYFLAGEAACVLDPASSHGVLRALMSGVAVGNAISQILSNGAEVKGVLRSYCAWMENWFCSDARALIELYSEFVPAPAWLASAAEAARYISMNPFF